ncbi:MAG TPA: UPF0158 family protein [Candidatus Eremiobacteraceae bacterium]|nr:UPF0158 family protein [Candidatus Eremiobacteraceae bacterium]
MSDMTTNHTHITAEWIRRPLDDLGGLSPSDAVGNGEGRKKLDDLLVELAGHYVRLSNLGLPAVNPVDIRKALGLEAPATPAGTHHHRQSRPHQGRAVKPGPVKRSALLDELGTALTGGDVDGASYFNSKTGAVEHFMHNLGDQENARIAEADANPDLVKIAPVTTDVRYSIMSDFIGSVEDINFAGRLRTAISGKGAFKRFRETVDEDDAMRRRWMAYRTKRHYHIALDWLHGLNADLSKYGLSGADYDWQPPKEDAERGETAQSQVPSPESATPEPAADQPADDAPAAEAPAVETAAMDVPAVEESAQA